MSKLGRVLFFLSFFALSVAADAATVKGRVTLSDGSPLPGVTMSVEGQSATTVTDADGQYTLEVNGAGGAVRVTAALQGFQTTTTTVDVSSGSATKDFLLRVSYGQEITRSEEHTSELQS